MHLHDLQQAFRKAAEQRAERLSQKLAEKGKYKGYFSVGDKDRHYRVNLPSITVKTTYGHDQYIERNAFLEAFAPLVGAAVMSKFNHVYNNDNDENESEASKSLRFAHRKRNFFENEGLGVRNGETMLGNGGILCGFQVDWRKSDLYEDAVSKKSERRKMFSFARGYLHAMEQSSPHPKYKGKDYIEISDVPHLDKALKVLAHVAHETAQNDQLPDNEKRLWQKAGYYTKEASAEKQPVHKRLFNIFKP